MKARRAAAKITYDGTDITANLQPYLLSFGLSDAMSGEADSIDISLEDRQGLWKGDWLPDRGAILDVTLTTENWQSGLEGLLELPLGKFEIDELQLEGAPNTVKIKAVSIPNNTALRSVAKTRSWEKTKLSVIAGDVARNAGMELFYDTDEDPELDRAEQTEQSDLEFLQKLTKDNGLALKVSDKQIVIFDMVKYEKADPIATLRRGTSSLLNYSITATIHEVYKACHVKYKDSKSGNLIEYTFTAPGKEKEDGLTLQVNEEVKSIAEAEKLAKKKLREKNCEEITVSITALGSFDLLASNTVMLENFGKFDGKYIIVHSDHSLGSGYTTKIDLRRCLNGY